MVSTHVVARIGKPHGLRGEVTIQPHTDRPEHRFVEGARFATDPPDAGPLTIVTVRQHQGVFLLGFEGVPDRSAAEVLRGTLMRSGAVYSQDQDGGAGSDEDVDDEGWYEEELLGLPVTLDDGTVLGEVSALHTRDVQDLLGVRLSDGREALVPFVEAIVTEVVLPADERDQGAARVVLDPPAGLLDLDTTGE